MALPGFIFGGDTGETADSLARKRLIAEAMIARANDGTPRNVGEGLSAIGKALAGRFALNAIDQRAATGRSEANATMDSLYPSFPAAPQASSGLAKVAAAMGGTSATADNSNLQAQSGDSSLAPEQKALLDTIAGPESGGRYDIMYGGGKIADLSAHPHQGVPITSGPNAGKTSSAAGKYQMLGSTWDDQAKKLGLTDFSPASQDKAAWNLAQESYRRATGNDLGEVLKSGDPQAIAGVGKALAPIWTSLPGGIEQGTNTSKFMTAFQRNLGQAPAAGAVNAMAQGRPIPQQVASLDPSIGVAPESAPSPDPGMMAAPGNLSPDPSMIAGIKQQISAQQPSVDPRQAIARAMAGQDRFPPELGPQDLGGPTGPSISPPELGPQDIAAQQAPQPGAVGGPGAVTPAGQRVLGQMMQPAPMSGGQAPMPMQGMPPQGQALPPPQAVPSDTSMPTQPPGGLQAIATALRAQQQGATPAQGASPGLARIAQAIQPSPAAATQQPAQQGQDLSQIPVMAGGSSGAYDPSQGPSLQQLYKAAQDPWLSDAQQSIVANQIQQKMRQGDPSYALDLADKRIKLQIAQQQLGGNFRGDSMDAQAWNILQTRDPSSREYATAYSIVSQPKTQMVQTPNGLVPVQVPPQLPSWVKAPGGVGGPAQGGGSGQAAPNGAPGSLATAGAPVPGTKQGGTETQARNGAITRILLGEAPTIGKNFKALSGFTDNALEHVPYGLGGYLQSEDYQRARGAIGASVSNILYSLSGASSNPDEVIKQIGFLTPSPTDKPAVVNDKLQRFKTYVRSIATEANDPDLMKSVDQAISQMDDPAVSPTDNGKGPPGIATPVTKSDFDALPSGALYTDPDDHKQYRKP